MSLILPGDNEWSEGPPLKGIRSEHLADKLILASHINAGLLGLVGDVTTVTSEQAAAAGVSGRFADAAHQHPTVSGTPVSVGTVNAEGSSAEHARRDHGHGINGPMVRAVWSANTSVANNGNAAIAFGGTDEYDTDTMHNPASNNTRITFNTAGVYDVGGYYVMDADIDGARGIYIQKNGTTIIAQKKITTAVFGGAPNDAMEISTHAKFAATDYVELFAQNIASGVALNVTNGAFYAVYQGAG